MHKYHLILYLAAGLLNGGMLRISSLVNIVIFIGSPLLIGTILITYGIEEVKRRKFVKSVEVIAFAVYLHSVLLEKGNIKVWGN